MKTLSRKWKRLNFSKQLAIVYIAIVAALIISILTFTGYSLSKIVENKLMEFFENALHQSSLNIGTTLEGYKNSINQMIVDTKFLDMLEEYDKANEEPEEQEPRIAFRNFMKAFLTYQQKVRCMSVRTEKGKIFSFDRLEIDSIYQKTILLHNNYFSENSEDMTQKRKSEWIDAEFLDRQGTKDYYIFTLKVPVYNWYNNYYVGELLMSIDEDTLAGICGEAKISDFHEMFIVNEEGNIISHMDKSLIGTDINPISVYEKEKNIVRTDSIEGTKWQLVSVLDKNYILEQLKKFYALLLILAVSVSAVAMVLIVYVSKHLSRSVKNIVTAMETVQEGELSVKVDVDAEDRNEITKIAARFNSMMNCINEQVEQIKESGQKEKEAELKALEAQINPHFIYNTLDSINWMAIENHEDEISEMLSEFAQILRYQINKSTKMVTIQEELSYLEMYLHIQKVRFSDTFEYVIDYNRQIGDCMIHKMLFQPFVENAIVHSFDNIDRGGLLKIMVAEVEENKICFIVADNGTGMPQELVDKLFHKREEVSQSIGIPNVLARLDVYYGTDYKLEVTSRETEGTTIKIWIPEIR